MVHPAARWPPDDTRPSVASKEQAGFTHDGGRRRSRPGRARVAGKPVSVPRAFVRACHPLPTAAVTVIVVACAWSLGWRAQGLVGVALAVLLGQLSVGWSNDAFDASADARALREEKPTVSGELTVRSLWIGAAAAASASAAASWWVAGWVGGSFHVAAVALAWLYNVRLSRTVWSWLPYALAFGFLPAFLTFGLDGSAPPGWLVLVFAIIGTAAHLANALRDFGSDTTAGLGGVVVSLGPRTSAWTAWLLLALGSGVLAVVAAEASVLLSVVAVLGFLGAFAYGSRSHADDALFRAILMAVVVDIVVVLVAA